jgi:uncharacterized membrane protein (DUF2068 family)
VLLLLLGVSLLFLNARTRWMDALSDWTADEILLEHSRAVAYVLHKLQAVLAGGTLHAAGLLALFYTAVLFTEGIGVYMQQRWAEFLMIFATTAFIPSKYATPGIIRVWCRAHSRRQLLYCLVSLFRSEAQAGRSAGTGRARAGEDCLMRPPPPAAAAVTPELLAGSPG